jgi:hypothetical protein
METKQFRHGELLLQQVEIIPEETVAKKSDVVANGKSGHAHRLIGGQILETSDGNAYLDITHEGAVIDHAEHGQISLQPGEKYEVIRQREYDPYEQAARAVED